MIASLSYKLSVDTPFYDGLDAPALERVYDLSRGDACNSFYIRASNHCGTHVDGPWHFNISGRKIADYAPDELVFTRPALLDISAGPRHLIVPGDLECMSQVRRDCDILLLRTGFSRFRVDARKYVDDAPGFSRTAAEYLLAVLPGLRALAVDFVSLASLAHMEEGGEAHRVLLGCAGYSDRTVLLVEDARLGGDLSTPDRILIVPWMIEGIDSAPCSVLAEFGEPE